MTSANVEMLERAAAALDELVDRDVVFVGGATIALWATDEATAEFRATDDVDVIVEVASRNDYYRFEQRLRGLGFVDDDDVICRFRHPPRSLVLDVMPTEAGSRETTSLSEGVPLSGRRQYMALRYGAYDLRHRHYPSFARYPRPSRRPRSGARRFGRVAAH
jgi:hypothetical protein